MDAIEWLQRWYQAQCDNEWEHRHGVKIESLDNPGWMVTIDLAGTAMSGAVLAETGRLADVNHAGTERRQDWLDCKVENNQFRGAGGPCSLGLIVEVFRAWVEQTTAGVSR